MDGWMALCMDPERRRTPATRYLFSAEAKYSKDNKVEILMSGNSSLGLTGKTSYIHKKISIHFKLQLAGKRHKLARFVNLLRHDLLVEERIESGSLVSVGEFGDIDQSETDGPLYY